MKKSEKLKLEIKREKDRQKLFAEKAKEKHRKADEAAKEKEEIKKRKAELKAVIKNPYFKKKAIFRFTLPLINKKSTSVFINMELTNGMFKHFVTNENNATFKFAKKLYHLDAELKYYSIDFKMWCYDFHEEYSLPIQRKLKINTIKKAIETSQITDVEYLTNPSLLEKFSVSKIAEGIMQGQQMAKVFQMIMVISLIAAAASVGMLVLFIIKSGMLESVRIPGVNG